MNVKPSLDENILVIDDTFHDCGDIVKRRLPIGEDKSVHIYVTYLDMMSNRTLIDNQIINQLMMNIRITPPSMHNLRTDIFAALKDGGVATVDVKETTDFEQIFMALLSGDTAIFIDGFDKAMIVSSRGFPNRGVQSTETEVVVQGSKEAFCEVLRFNTALVRRRIRDTQLKVRQVKVGRRSGTDVALMFLEDVVRPQVLKEVEERIGSIDIDAILDSGYVEQFIEDDWKSPFPQAQVTERPDKAAAAILEGRIVIIVDNSPFVLIVPVTMNCFFQSSEDYYQRWEIMSFVRVIRYIAGIISVCLPGFYIAAAAFHPSMIPMLLTFKMAAARQNIPFPGVLEVLAMDLAFELLREAGIRLPGPIGSTIGIVGGLIIGQAAVEAGLVSPIVVIVISLTGIAGFAIPHVSLVTGFRLIKYAIIIAAASMGLFGFWIAILFILIHLVSLKSFGIPYMLPYSMSDVNGYNDLKDSILRLPIFMMKKRPIFANPDCTIRLKERE